MNYNEECRHCRHKGVVIVSGVLLCGDHYLMHAKQLVRTEKVAYIDAIQARRRAERQAKTA
jgi:hypothetical protein